MGARVCSQKECCSNGYSLREIYTVSALLPNPLTAEEMWKIVLKKKKQEEKLQKPDGSGSVPSFSYKSHTASSERNAGNLISGKTSWSGKRCEATETAHDLLCQILPSSSVKHLLEQLPRVPFT